MFTRRKLMERRKAAVLHLLEDGQQRSGLELWVPGRGPHIVVDPEGGCGAQIDA